MARSATSVGSALRRIIVRTYGPDFRFSCGSPRGFLLSQQQIDDRCPVWLPSNLSDDPPSATTFSERLSSCCGWSGREKDHPSGSGTSVTSCLSGRWSISNNVSIIEIPKLKRPEQRWTHQSWSALSSAFGLHSSVSMGSRGFTSGTSDRNSKEDTPSSVTPTSSSEGAENAVKSGTDWAEAAYNGIVDAAKALVEAIDDAAPPVKTFLQANPIIMEISLPVTIFTGAWVILPRVLRQVHSYVERGSAVLLQGQDRQWTPGEMRIPYDLSVWKAMEDPARLFATLLTALQVGMIVSPSPAVAQYLTQFWSGGSVLCVVWFLHRWKGNTFKRLLEGRQVSKEERERYSGFDKISSLGLLFIGGLGVAEAAGVAVSSLLTVGGIGGIATAFAAREILANLLTGLTLSFSKPFTVGDVIKAGGVEGKVEEVGMISTRLLNLEKKPIIVPNAFFTSQAIINKSRAPWQYMATKIPIHLTDFEKVPIITLEIREMLLQNPQVYLEEDKPRCHISQFSPSALELAITCNIKPMSKNEYLLVEQGILVEAARIITMNGATLGGP